MMKMNDFEIIDTNAWELKKEMINKFQELSGRLLTEASPETKIFETVAYLLSLREEKYNDEIKQNYLRYARNERLDLKGEIYGKRGERIKELPASATFRFYISNIQNTDVVIPKKSKIKYGELFFETNEEYKILKNTLYIDGLATCTSKGEKGNGILIGQIKEMVDIYPYYEKVENITISNGGTNIEEDENYRERIKEIAESFTTAGSKEAYIYWAKSNPNVLDVKVISPEPTKVDVYVLTKDASLSIEIKDNIFKLLNDENIRPLTDKVEIKTPIIREYDIDFDYYIDKENEFLVNSIKNNIDNVVNEYVNWQKEKLGRSINPDELIKRIKLAGVKRIVLRQPQYNKLEFNQVGIVRNKTINYQGVEEL